VAATRPARSHIAARGRLWKHPWRRGFTRRKFRSLVPIAVLPVGVFRMTRPAAKAKPPKKDSYHHGDLRRALMDATLRLVEENGPQGFTLRAASRAAGVTPGATYHHFGDKD